MSKSKSWREITDEKEKYAAYLCSREWNVLKEQVKKRSHGICERCKCRPMNAVHHLTYERKYKEELCDLEAICNQCHEFTHAKTDIDPKSLPHNFRMYMWTCRVNNLVPMPYEIQGLLVTPKKSHQLLMAAIDSLELLTRFLPDDDMDAVELAIDEAVMFFNRRLPYDYKFAMDRNIMAFGVEWYASWIKLCGFEQMNSSLLTDQDEGDEE